MEQCYKPRSGAACCERNLRRRVRAPPCGGSANIRACGAPCSFPFRCTTKKGTTFVVPFLVVHRKEFESLAFGSVDQRSIQLS